MNIPSSRNATEIVTACLVPGERLLWAGRPKQGFALRGWDILSWPLSILAAIMGTLLTVMQWREPGNPGVLIFALLWTAGAYYAAIGRFVIDRWQRSMTYYAVTDQRAIILTKESPDYIRSIDLKTVKEISHSRRSDSTGTLEFNRPGLNSFQRRLDVGRGAALPSMDIDLTPAFEMIANAREVRDLIVQAQQEAQQRP